VGDWDKNFRNGVVQQWNFSVQREFVRSWVFTAAYVGAKGNHLESTQEENPGIFGPVGNLQQRRRYPDFSSIALTGAQGNMTYHALQLSANRRLAHGITVLASYTFSKNIDNGAGNGVNDASPRDGSNFRAEKGLSSNDIPHKSAWARQVLGGWEVNGITTFESGTYFNVVSGRDNSGNGINLDRPDLLGNPYLPTGRPRAQLIARWFDPNAFRQNAPGTYGNIARNLLEGPGKAVVDLGIVKSFFIRERHRVQFRAEAFNAFNRVNLDAPNANIAAATVGRITSDSPPRVFQLALRYQF
jgi:hypothetical protein